MAFFKFRQGKDEQSSAAPQPESVEVLRRRAKNRLIGAAILVLIGVIGFPLLVDKQPRPVMVDLPISIPDRNKVLPLPSPGDAASPASVAAGAVVEDAPPSQALPAPAPAPAASAVTGKKTDNVKADARPETRGEAKPALKPEPKSEPKSESKAEAKPDGRADQKTDGKASDGRYVVQVGSFADESRAREVRARLERAGLKNYVQAVDTRDGRRIRVRAGPFASRAEAERAVERLKKLDLPAALLTL